jgi:acetyltransferase
MAQPSFDLNPIFFPKSMVVVGLSRQNDNHPGNTTFLKNMLEMKVKAFGVSPTCSDVNGYKIYPTINKLPEVPDLAVICLSAQNTFGAIKEAAEFGIKGAIVIGGGFAETGADGKKLQEDIVKICIDHNMPMIGPNCVGIYAPPNLDTIFLPSERIIRPKLGNVAIVSQSGGVLLDQFFLSCLERDIGVSAGVSIGNKAMINETMLLEYFEKDQRTDIIAFYIEGFEPGEGRLFGEAARKSRKDVVAFIGGNTKAGKIAAGSHTASLSGDGAIIYDAFKQYSIMLAKSELELKNMLKVYSTLANPHRRYSTMAVKGRLGVLTLSGGHGVLCADLLEKYGLELSQFGAKQKEEMEFLMNPTAAKIAGFNNPIDVTGAVVEDDIVYLMEYLLNQPNVDILLMLLLPYPPQISMHLGRKIMKVSNKYQKPIVTFLPWTEKYNLLRESLEINFIPCAHTVEEAVMMASAIKQKGEGGLRKKFNWHLTPKT